MGEQDHHLNLEGFAIQEANAAKDRLRSVPTGELAPDAPTYAQLQAEVDEMRLELEGLQEAHRSAMAKVRALRRDKNAEAHDHELWGLAIALFNEWRYATGHMRSRWTADRFWVCQPSLAEYGFPMCRYAVWGLAANCYRKQITPGYEKRYDEFWRVFGPSAGVQSADHFEGWANVGRALFGDWLEGAS